MEPKIIKNETEYHEMLKTVEQLIDIDPDPGTSEAERMDVLSLLVEKYENEHFVFQKPTPIEAILFRMQEQGLKQRDLEPYIGSKSKVSEVLSGKRPLSLSMVRALNKGLGLPAEVLLQEADISKTAENKIEWQRFPLREMIKRGWLKATTDDIKSNAKGLMRNFSKSLGEDWFDSDGVFCRTSFHQRVGREMDKYALLAWTARVKMRAQADKDLKKYLEGTVTLDFMKEVAHLSCSDKGPLLALEFLKANGIALIIEPQLPKTQLDGGAMLSNEGNPIIGMTLRYDRLDNFWYTLMHELAHVAKHLTSPEDIYIDDLVATFEVDIKELEADKLAREVFIPRKLWRRSDAFQQRTPEAIKAFAMGLGIHYSIVAGRIRYELNNYKMLYQLIGNKEVRKLFKEMF